MALRFIYHYPETNGTEADMLDVGHPAPRRGHVRRRGLVQLARFGLGESRAGLCARAGGAGRIGPVNLMDATLVVRTESAGHPAVAELAQSAYERLANGEEVGYQVLDDLIGQASGKGVLRAMKDKYDPVAFDAIIMPILAEIGRTKPIRSSRPQWRPAPGADPLA